MTKRIIATMVVLLIGLPLLFIAGSALILFLAPGTEIFGIRYIQSGFSNYQYSEKLEAFGGDIYIETQGVPVNIIYSDYYNARVEFSQHFIGFTRSENEKASISVNVDEKTSNLIIKTHELVKFIYAQETEDTYNFNIVLPYALYRGRSIYIKSEKSTVKVIGNADVDEFSLETEELLTIDGSIKANKFKYHTEKYINIDDKIICNNLDLKSTGSGISVQHAITGNLVAETNSGEIRFVSCKNFTAKTTSGSIKSYGEGLNSVQQAVSIESRSGSIQLGQVNTANANVECVIKSRTSSVSISSMQDGEIITERGSVYIDSARNVVINANFGNVVVNKASEGIVVNGYKGSVTLGENGTVMNPKVTTNTGAIEVKNASGIVDIKASYGKVDFENKDSSNIKIYAEKDLNATGLKGSVEIYSNGDVNLTFANISDNVLIETGSKSDSVVIDATCIAINRVNYKCESTRGTKARVYAGVELVKESTKIESEEEAGYKTITVKASYGEIVLKFGETA